MITITERQFYNTAELREMVKGFELLFGITPDVRIKVKGPNGGPTSTLDHTTDEMLFFTDYGFQLARVGNRYVTLHCNEPLARITVDDNCVTYHATFYLP